MRRLRGAYDWVAVLVPLVFWAIVDPFTRSGIRARRNRRTTDRARRIMLAERHRWGP